MKLTCRGENMHKVVKLRGEGEGRVGWREEMGGKKRRQSFVYPAYGLAHAHLLRLPRRLHRQRLNYVRSIRGL
jgi:hypothetical protein